ncbi:hypothetical protein M5362_31700 [Streptomyces sp. Je 1-79]|uniref:hypothetical protein n=1 Tax=Streptomyces sp. Je 1-79 TaxID=2943847 RepID=UPI0021A7A591|nr:hypothetical protein [Streptomyces sp. Je 1-79]MCT4357670.1 hypothetical protein [Streptomyces sp. Je 1-79]
MHMNVAPHLLTEDRAEYVRLLDDALRNAHDHPDLAETGKRLTAEQLRTMALNATALITAAAAVEYDHFVKVREEGRSPSGSSVMNAVLAAEGEGVGAGPGAGVVAIVTVLAPVLAGTAAVIFLLVGAVLKVLAPTLVFADTLLTAAWFFGAVAAAGLFCAAVGLLLTALRNRSTQLAASDPPRAETDDELSRAREAWRRALLERGILPFLRDALAAPLARPATPPGPPPRADRIPKIGYSGPDFSSPNEGSSGTRPTYSSPDFSSPDFGPPDHRPE